MSKKKNVSNHPKVNESRLSISLDKKLHKKLKIYSTEHDKTIRDIVALAITKFLK